MAMTPTWILQPSTLDPQPSTLNLLPLSLNSKEMTRPGIFTERAEWQLRTLEVLAFDFRAIKALIPGIGSTARVPGHPAHHDA